MKIDVLFDTTGFIDESVNEIGIELGLAVLLTALVCWVFLGSLSSTMNVLFAIPMSLLGTIAILYFAGFTLNTFTLLGLSLAVGLVVDDAVMVMENIFRHAEMGKDRITAASEGTKEITFAALAATIAVIAIFMPVAFMSGVVGKFFLQFGVTLSVAVAHLVRRGHHARAGALRADAADDLARDTAGSSGGWPTAAFDALSRGYAPRARARRCARRGSCLASASRCSAVAGFVATRIQQEFVPSQDQSRLSVKLTTAVGAEPRRDRRARPSAPRQFLASVPRSIDVLDDGRAAATRAALA